MARYIAKRILYMIPVLLGVTLLVFFIMHLAPGNVAGMILGENATPEQIAALEHEMGLDRPLLVQYSTLTIWSACSTVIWARPTPPATLSPVRSWPASRTPCS